MLRRRAMTDGDVVAWIVILFAALGVVAVTRDVGRLVVRGWRWWRS
jgi:hypothetical protein